VTRPEDAVARAREEAEAKRGAGAYDDELPGFHVESTDRVDADQLARWALIEPDPDEVYSTRRLGAPLTLLKRALLRVLRQYHVQVLSQQSRFNAQVVSHLLTLEERVERLEAEARAKR
jgi:hypothetical protein